MYTYIIIAVHYEKLFSCKSRSEKGRGRRDDMPYWAVSSDSNGNGHYSKQHYWPQTNTSSDVCAWLYFVSLFLYMWSATCCLLHLHVILYLNHQPISAVGWYMVDIIRLLNFLFLKPPFLFGVSAAVGGNLL